MSILDYNGNPISSYNFVNSARRNAPERPFQPVRLDDIDKLIPRHDRNTLVSVSRKMFANMGLPRGAILQKASYAVGRGWDTVFEGKDKEWGDSVAKLLNEQWYKMCDIRGQNFDFKTLLHLDSIALDRDGDFAIILTESETGYPQMQRIGTHRIGQRNHIERVESGEYKGLKIRDGVIRNRFDRPVAYRVLGDTENEDKDISAQDMILVFDPDWHEQSRGLPAFSHCLDDLRDMAQSTQWEQQVMLMISSIGLIEYNDTGMPDIDDPSIDLLGDVSDPNNGGLTTKTMSGGMYRYMKANSGNKLESLKMERPCEIWDRFNDRLTRSALAGVKWPYSMSWKSEGNSTIERSDIEKAMRTVEDRQDVLRGAARRVINWVVAKLIKSGRIHAPKHAGDWYAFNFKMPAKISINFKNDTQAFLKLYEQGGLNLTDILAMQGKDPETHFRQRANEIADMKRIKAEVEAETGQKIDDREMRLITANEQKEESTTTKEND